MRNPDQQTCETCHHWDGDKQPSICRKNPPTPAGWPQTAITDWCGAWARTQRSPVRPQTRLAECACALLWNYAFVRDYPERATLWLETVLADPAAIPEALRVLVDAPLGDPRTMLMPETADRGPCCDVLYFWAEQIPGFDNEEDDHGYIALIISSDDADAVATSRQAFEELPIDHPWQALAWQVGEQTRAVAQAHPDQTADRPRGEEGAAHG